MKINRFKNFILQEKVSKTEMNSSLNDSNVIIGVEFEYIDKFVREGVLANQDDGSVLSDFNKLQREVELSVAHRIHDEKQYNKDMKDEYIYQFDKIKDRIKEIEAEMKDMKIRYGDEWDSNRTMEYADLEVELEDAKKELNEMKNMEIWEWGESNGWLYDYSERVGGVNIEPTEQLMNWWNEKHKIADYDIEEAISSYVYFDDGSDWDGLPQPAASGKGGLYSSEPAMKEWTKATNQFFRFDDLPSFVKPYKVLYYQENKSYPGWQITEDPSLTKPGNLEIVMVPTPITDMKKVVGGMFDFIDRNGYTDNSCGMHVHISYKGADMVKDLDLFKLMLFLEEGWIAKNFPERAINIYCKSMLKKIDRNFDKTHFTHKDHYVKEDLTALIQSNFDIFGRKYMPSSDKYNSVNWEPMKSKSPHIEIRWAGAKQYHKRYDTIKATIARYAYYMKLALDKDFKKKEYIQKLYKLITREEYGDEPADNLQHKQDLVMSKKIQSNGNFLGTGYGNYVGSFGSNTQVKHTIWSFNKMVYAISGLDKVEKITNSTTFKTRLRSILANFKIRAFEKSADGWFKEYGEK